MTATLAQVLAPVVFMAAAITFIGGFVALFVVALYGADFLLPASPFVVMLVGIVAWALLSALWMGVWVALLSGAER